MLAVGLGIVAIFLFLLAFYKWATLNNDYFEKRDIKYLKPTFLFGFMGEFLLGRKTLAAFAEDLYRAFPNEPYVIR